MHFPAITKANASSYWDRINDINESLTSCESTFSELKGTLTELNQDRAALQLKMKLCCKELQKNKTAPSTSSEYINYLKSISLIDAERGNLQEKINKVQNLYNEKLQLKNNLTLFIATKLEILISQ